MTNDADEKEKMADKSVLMKLLDCCERIRTERQIETDNFCLQERLMIKYLTANKHCLTCFIFWTVPPTNLKDKWSVTRQDGAFFQSPVPRWNLDSGTNVYR